MLEARGPMKVYEIRDILDATVLTGEDNLDRTVSGAGGADLMQAFLAAATKDAVILTGLTTDDLIRTAKVSEVAAVVFVRGMKPEASALALAHSFELPTMVTRHSLFVASGKLYMHGLRGLDGSW
jgi:predicted transcriptional regulator